MAAGHLLLATGHLLLGGSVGEREVGLRPCLPGLDTRLSPLAPIQAVLRA